MLTVLGRGCRFCDGITRRGFLRVSGSLAAGLGLAPRTGAGEPAEAASGHKAVIIVYLPGGPSHLDLFDLKPDSPAEVRGAFRPIRTRVPGVEISELLPRLAGVADRLAILRSV